MAEPSTNSAGTSAAVGQKKKDTFVVYILIGLAVIGFLWGVKAGVFGFSQEGPSAQSDARSGMYKMRDVTDNSAEGASNREKFVNISFTPGRLDLDYSVTLNNGQTTTVQIYGTTLDGVHYTAKFRRADRGAVDADEWVCTFQNGSGHCLVPNVVGGLNRMEFQRL